MISDSSGLIILRHILMSLLLSEIILKKQKSSEKNLKKIELKYSSMIAMRDLDKKLEMRISLVFQIELLSQIKLSKRADMNSRKEVKMWEE